MSPERIGSDSELHDFLLAYFEADFNLTEPKPRMVNVGGEHWGICAMFSDGKVFYASLTIGGTTDLYRIKLDPEYEFEHVSTDTNLSIDDKSRDINAQVEMGMTAPNEVDLARFDELIEALKSEASPDK